MIFRSVLLMTIFDFIIVSIAVYASWVLCRYKQLLRQLRVLTALLFIMLGIHIAALFYLVDLLTMFILPVLINKTAAMHVMTTMHLNIGFLVNMTSLGFVVVGISRLVRRLLPRIARMMDFLEQTKEQLKRDIVKRRQAEAALQEAHDILEQRVAARTIDLQHLNERLQTEITEHHRTEAELRQKNDLLNTLKQIQSDFVLDVDRQSLFDQLLRTLLELTQSEYGFIGEVLYTPEGKPYLKTFDLTNIAWSEETRALYEQHAPLGFEFHNLNTLFGAVLTTGEAVIANDPSRDPRSGGLPPGHPPLHAFLGLPVHSGDKWVGMIGIANRPHGYDQDVIAFLQPVLNTCGNILEIRQNDQRRQLAERALQESEARYRALVEQSLVGIYIIQDRGFRYVNPKFAEIFGYTADEITTTLCPAEQLIAEQDRARVLANIQQRLRGEANSVHYTFQGIRRDGALIDLEIHGSVTRIDGEPAVIGTALDITERKRLEEQLRQSQKMEAIGTLAGGIAHDFNNILSILMNALDLIQYQSQQDSVSWPIIQDAHAALERGKDMVQQILAFSRQAETAKKPVYVDQQVDEALRLLRASLPTTIEIQRHFSKGIGMVLAHPTQLQQVLMNLCSNAEHAMRETGGMLEVRLDNVEVDADFTAQHPALQAGPHVRIMVRDTGHGIDPETLKRIFEPFFTTKEVGEGTGMGLSVVHGIVTQHDGAITVESERGAGTTFTIYLPRLLAAPEPPTHFDAPIAPGTGCILFVDDEAMLSHLGQLTLEQLGYDVVSKTSSIEALDAFRAMPEGFDLVITDQTMPHMSGEMLARELRHIRPDIPIILCTGYSHTIDAEKAQTQGIDAFCMKPLSAQKLAEMIRHVLRQRAKSKLLT